MVGYFGGGGFGWGYWWSGQVFVGRCCGMLDFFYQLVEMWGFDFVEVV